MTEQWIRSERPDGHRSLWFHTDGNEAFLLDGWRHNGTLDTAKADAEKGLRDLCTDVIKDLEKP